MLKIFKISLYFSWFYLLLSPFHSWPQELINELHLAHSSDVSVTDICYFDGKLLAALNTQFDAEHLLHVQGKPAEQCIIATKERASLNQLELRDPGMTTISGTHELPFCSRQFSTSQMPDFSPKKFSAASPGSFYIFNKGLINFGENNQMFVAKAEIFNSNVRIKPYYQNSQLNQQFQGLPGEDRTLYFYEHSNLALTVDNNDNIYVSTDILNRDSRNQDFFPGNIIIKILPNGEAEHYSGSFDSLDTNRKDTPALNAGKHRFEAGFLNIHALKYASYSDQLYILDGTTSNYSTLYTILDNETVSTSIEIFWGRDFEIIPGYGIIGFSDPNFFGDSIRFSIYNDNKSKVVFNIPIEIHFDRQSLDRQSEIHYFYDEPQDTLYLSITGKRDYTSYIQFWKVQDLTSHIETGVDSWEKHQYFIK